MPDQMNYYHLLGVKSFVHNAVVTNSQLVEPSQVAAEGIWLHCLYVSCQPLNALDNTTCDLLVKLCEFACSRTLDADLVHDYSSPSSLTRSSSGWPYCPLATAFL